ncbi:zinc finger, CCHC-type containing protein [Tanacetum coccineum]|uniref:Zinc finger, CCHC-type containing protein n=1 Tax=Tanacetum coccineum TaxID=301880 RepID=A0ABQ4YKU2_9ASTR
MNPHNFHLIASLFVASHKVPYSHPGSPAFLFKSESAIALSVEDKLDYLEQLIPPALVPAQAGQQVAPEALAAHTAWVKGSKEIVGLMFMTMETNIQRNLENLNAYDMLQELKTLFAQQADEELLQTVRDFHTCKQEEGQSVSSCVLKMKSYIENLERLGHLVSLNLGVSLILISLRTKFDSFVQNYNMHGMGKTVNELHAMLKLHEKTLTKKDPALHGSKLREGENKLAYAPKPKISPPPKRENPAKDSVCHQCGDTVSRNNMVYFSVVPRDGIFEIDLSNSNINNSSMYVVSNKRAKLNLDSALLWYCRLGHISKKRIEKLQHDGLLNSTDLRAFEKRVSLFQKEVENQLGKTIKSLRSNHVGEYMSQEFLDHLKEHEIIAHRTPPYTPQHNGVLERRNRTLLDMVCSMMSQTTLPKSFWDYVVETVARILNMIPTKKVEKIPYKVWHGQALKLSYLKVWGCEH